MQCLWARLYAPVPRPQSRLPKSLRSEEGQEGEEMNTILDWPAVEKNFRDNAPSNYSPEQVDMAVQALKRMYDERMAEFYLCEHGKLHAVTPASRLAH